MTDHGNLHGAYDFYSKAKKHDIRPIIGIEAYLTPQTDRSERRRVKWGKGDARPRRAATTSRAAAPTPT